MLNRLIIPALIMKRRDFIKRVAQTTAVVSTSVLSAQRVLGANERVDIGVIALPRGSVSLERFQIFNEVGLLGLSESKSERGVVVVYHVEQRCETAVMKESAFGVREQAL